MLFSSLVFLTLFLPLTMLIYYFLKPWRQAQNIFIFLVSLFFYAWGEPVFVLILVFSIFLNWGFGLLLVNSTGKRTQRRIVLILSLVLNLGIMYYFKYHMFTLSIFKTWFPHLVIPFIRLPIGISFFTFQALSYVLDIYLGKVQANRNPFQVGLYIALFPQLIAGPILRYETIAEQINFRKENVADFSHGLVRFIIGLGKKVLLANQFALISEESVRRVSYGAVTPSGAWVGIVAYAFQILFDFAGYSDMAIGLGKMMGFHFPENFDHPYISVSVSEFWRRWHISLGTWFREYVYFPLGGSRVSNKGRVTFNLFVVWALTGIWHGANWTFIVWGIFYFLLIAIEKAIDYEKLLTSKGFSGWLMRRLGHFYTMTAVLIGWVLFRAANLRDAWGYLGVMFQQSLFQGLQPDARMILGENKVFFIAAFLACFPWIEWFSSYVPKTPHWLIFIFNLAKGIVLSIGVLFILIISMTYLIKGSYNPFIYFNF